MTRPAGGQTGNGGAVRPPVEARVTPPAVLGRDLPEVRVRTPEATVELPAGLTAAP